MRFEGASQLYGQGGPWQSSLQAIDNEGSVAQTSESAVSPISKSAGRGMANIAGNCVGLRIHCVPAGTNFKNHWMAANKEFTISR